MKKQLPYVSIIAVNYNGKELLSACFGSLLDLNYPKNRIEIIMVDNGSTDGSLEYTKKGFPGVKIIVNKENNYARANNLGIKMAKGEYVALINNDVEVDKDWLIKLVETAEKDSSVGAVGSKILFPDGSVQSVGHAEFPNFYWCDIGFMDKDSGKYTDIKEVVSICGCSVLYRKKCLDEIGLLDEDFNIFVEDVDMAIRCRNKGWRLFTCPQSIICHKLHSTMNQNKCRYWLEANRLLLIAKHWPEKLADELMGNGYFTVRSEYNNNDDISVVLSRTFKKIIKEHGWQKFDELSPGIFRGVRKIYDFDKEQLSQKQINAQSQIDKLIKELDTARKENLESVVLGQQKDKEASELRLKNEEADSLLKQKEKEISDLRLQTEKTSSILQQKEKEASELRFETEEAASALRQRKEEITALQEKQSKLLSLLHNELENTKLQLQQKRNELSRLYSSTGYRYILRPLWDLLWPIKQLSIKTKNLSRKIACFFNVGRLINSIKNAKITKRISYFCNLLFIAPQIISAHRSPWLNAYQNHLKYGTFPPCPDTLILMLTKRCNLTCQFCDISNLNEEMITADAIRVIDNAYRLGLRWLIITGGEPLLHKGVFDIASYAKNLGFKVGITTNGILIKENVNKIHKSGIDVISVSLDGFSESHDALRGKAGLFEQVKANILMLKTIIGEEQEITINFVLTNKNINDLEPLYDWARTQKIFFDFWPVNHHKELNINMAGDYSMLRSFVKKLRKNRHISRSKYYYYINTPLYLNGNKDLRVRCLALVRNLGVDVNGDITPCCVWNKEKMHLGNAIKDDLEALWHSNEYRRLRVSLYRQGCSGGCYNNSLHEFTNMTGKSFIITHRE